MRTSQKSITEVCRILICSLADHAANRSVSQGADALLRTIEETCFSTILKFLKPRDPSILLLKTFPICLVYRRGNVSESSLKRFQNWGIVYAGVCLTAPVSEYRSPDEGCSLSDEQSFEFYEKALHGLIQIEPKAKKIKPYLQYQIGTMYFKGLGTSIDNTKTVEYFERSADKNMWASYQLGKLYLFGTENIQKDKEKAMKYLNLSAEQGNEYAQNILNNQGKFENEMLANTVFSLFVNLSHCIEDDYHKNFQSGRKMIDSKLRKMIQEKNQALGIKQEHGQTQQY